MVVVGLVPIMVIVVSVVARRPPVTSCPPEVQRHDMTLMWWSIGLAVPALAGFVVPGLGTVGIIGMVAMVASIVVVCLRFTYRKQHPELAGRPVAPAEAQPVTPMYTLVTMPDGSQQMVPVMPGAQGTRPGDAPSGGFATLGFFFPVVGLILYLVWKDRYPRRSHSAGKGALIGVIVDMVMGVVVGILYAVLLSAWL